MPRQGRVFDPFWSENGYRICPFNFGSEVGYDSRGNSQECMHIFIVSIPSEVERKKKKRNRGFTVRTVLINEQPECRDRV